jgi:hypothetical protein
MDGEELGGGDGATLVDGLTNDIDDSSESLLANGHHNGGTGVLDTLASDETFGGVESDGSHVVSSEMLGNLEHESVLGSLDLKGVENGGELAGELHIDDGTNDLGDFSSSGGECL